MAGRVNGGGSVLIVARPGSWRDALQAMLDEIPRIETIHLASDAASALLSAAAHCPDLALLDTDLPGGWAWTLTHELKMVCPHTRSLVLTNELPHPERPGTVPVDAVLVKGCSATVLFEALESLLPEQKRDPQRENEKALQIEEVMLPNPI